MSLKKELISDVVEIRKAPAGVTKYELEQQVNERLYAYGHSQFFAVREVHLRSRCL